MGRPKDIDVAPRRIECGQRMLWCDHAKAIAAAERLRERLPVHPVPDPERELPSATPMINKALRLILETTT